MKNRMRRLRLNANIREVFAETALRKEDLIYPLFVKDGVNEVEDIKSLKGQKQYTVDKLDEVIKELKDLGIRSVILFGVPEHKDACGSGAYAKDGVVQRAIRKIKELDKDFIVIGDVCMCEYTDHGHCGILHEDYVDNDETVSYLQKIAVSMAEAGVDIVAPSDMMDGRVAKIREALDDAGYINVSIMSYASKFASNYYGPFRDAAGSAPSFGDRKQYQMDYRNKREALREILLDVDEGADMLIVKPAMAYGDIIKLAAEETKLPIVAYSVSGEYAMLYDAVAGGLVKEDIIMETMLSFKRAGANLIITYFAKYLAERL
ncbi:porphobilinogen synthase [Fenollaria sporofastidiosus]|uniref:porphobilinogen synthase n=1 Tax=Fenollaria sporofastidiosus TaxID=2811778 RepID=UPI001BFFEDFE|nr:porphobilinogen synthase [Fenollaria sporofastidiosus]